MVTVSAYWRPGTLGEALVLLSRPGAIPIGGGVMPIGGARRLRAAADPVEVVDLQALGLNGVKRLNGAVSIGALVTLQQIADDAAVPDQVRQAARREQPSGLRAVVTVGECVAAAGWESEFLATLLAYDAAVTLDGPRSRRGIGLGPLLADPGQLSGLIITGVTVASGGPSHAARTGRTPADRPIVAAVARRGADGRRLALSGVAAAPVLVPVAGADGLAGLDRLDPPGDFRGSARYRRALAAILARRALEAISLCTSSSP